MTKAMKIKYLDNSSERRIDTTNWKQRSAIILEDGTFLVSSTGEYFFKSQFLPIL